VPSLSLITNHGLALLCIAEDPRARMREIAASLNVTERAAQRIVSELIDAGYVHRTREGRRNRYTLRLDLPVALPRHRGVDLSALLTVLMPSGARKMRPGELAAAVS
jgi:hypothetical protein